LRGCEFGGATDCGRRGRGRAKPTGSASRRLDGETHERGNFGTIAGTFAKTSIRPNAFRGTKRETTRDVFAGWPGQTRLRVNRQSRDRHVSLFAAGAKRRHCAEIDAPIALLGLDGPIPP
jgi:hypothetical protein